MSTIARPHASIRGVGYITAAVILAWAAYFLVNELEPNGRNFVVLGALRVVLFGALLSFARLAGAQARRVGRVGLVMAAAGAVLTLAGGIGAVATDGWWFDPFAPDAVCTCSYAYVIGLGALVFALGTTLVGVAGRSGGWLAVAVVLAGVLYPAVFILQPFGHFVGHAVWLVPWAALAVGLSTDPSRTASSAGAVLQGRKAQPLGGHRG